MWPNANPYSFLVLQKLHPDLHVVLFSLQPSLVLGCRMCGPKTGLLPGNPGRTPCFRWCPQSSAAHVGSQAGSLMANAMVNRELSPGPPEDPLHSSRNDPQAINMGSLGFCLIFLWMGEGTWEREGKVGERTEEALSGVWSFQSTLRKEGWAGKRAKSVPERLLDK